MDELAEGGLLAIGCWLLAIGGFEVFEIEGPFPLLEAVVVPIATDQNAVFLTVEIVIICR